MSLLCNHENIIRHSKLPFTYVEYCHVKTPSDNSEFGYEVLHHSILLLLSDVF